MKITGKMKRYLAFGAVFLVVGIYLLIRGSSLLYLAMAFSMAASGFLLAYSVRYEYMYDDKGEILPEYEDEFREKFGGADEEDINK